MKKLASSPKSSLLRAAAFLAVLLTTSVSFAAVASYTITATSGSIMTASNTLKQTSRYAGHSYNYNFGIFNIGFTFPMDGVNYTQIGITGSGVVSLGGIALNNNYNNVIGAPNVPVIAPFWDQLIFSGGTGSYTPRCAYGVSGTAPNRVMVVSWEHLERAMYYENLVNVQVRMYENGTIEFWYGNMKEGPGRWGNGATSASIGLAVNSTNFLSLTPQSSGAPTKSSTTANNAINLNSVTIGTGTMFILRQVPNVQLGCNLQPHAYNFGSLGTGQSATFNLIATNVGDNSNGTSRMAITSVTITGMPDFSIVSAPASNDSIDAGTSRNIIVKFAPIIDGVRTATVTVTSTGIDSGTQVFSFTGIGLAPLISVDTNVLFKNKFVKMGDSLVAKVKIFSTNTPTLFINALNIVGDDAGEYYISRGPSSNAIPGPTGVDSVLIGYRPTKEGRHIATLQIVNNSINNPVLPITLYGTAVLPHVIIAPNPLLFDSIKVGTDSCKKIRISNPGTDTLLIRSNLLVSNDGDFIYTGLVGADSIIPPDKFKEVIVCFHPKSKGSRTARLRITTNIPKTFEQPSRDTASQFLIDIRGTGVPFGAITQQIGDMEGGSWNDQSIIGREICSNDTLWNNGGADIRITAMTFAGAAAANYSVTGASVPFTIKANGYVVVKLCCTPTTQGQNPATFTLNGTSSEKPISSVATLSIKGLLVCATATPNPLFDKQLIVEGSDSTLCVEITNCGDVPTDYTASLPSGTDYSIDGASSTGIVAPGAKAKICVKFHPSVMGDIKTTLTITPSTPELAPLSVPVGGVGACAQMAANTPAITGGAGGKSTFQITINNTGNYAWSAGTPTLTQSDNAFDISGQSVNPDPIPANSNGTLTVKYNPTQINHTYTGEITFPNAIPSCSNSLKVDFSHTTGTESVSKVVEEAGFSLGQNHPNPFVASTEFSYTTPAEALVTLSLRDITGKLIRTISSGTVSSGDHNISLTASDLASGTYLLMLESGNVQLIRQITINR
ncbi:MAG TPA: choice-of-anchor D domain-containing protein [Candidatus Kapabacteria bacterium]|nr:choice-of-anchor D domain-containing protein [Candidatus Kapabacteria bacterium]